MELHVRQGDWKNHGHSKDLNYNDVVLHAAWEVDSQSTDLKRGNHVPVVSLAPLLDPGREFTDDPGAHPPKIDLPADAWIAKDL